MINIAANERKVITMRKITLIVLTILAISILTGCSKPVITEKTEVTFCEVNGELRDVRIINPTR